MSKFFPFEKIKIVFMNGFWARACRNQQSKQYYHMRVACIRFSIVFVGLKLADSFIFMKWKIEKAKNEQKPKPKSAIMINLLL